MSSKIDRALYGPSWTEVILGAALSVLVGVVLAAAWLVTKPVEVVGAMPLEPVPGKVYFIGGSVSSGGGKQWVQKSQQLIAGKTVSVSEMELNAAAQPAAPATAAEAKTGMIVPGAVNFRINDGELQIGAPVNITVAGFSKIVQVWARGGFERDGDRFVYTPREFHVGACSVEKLPVISDLLKRKLMESVKVPDELVTAWDKLANVTITGTQLNLLMP